MTPQERYAKLTEHLQEENPLLLDAIERYQQLDRIAWKMGLLPCSDSYAAHISWWPLISLLGTFSAGKSSFINSYVGKKVQDTGNQAVDEKFTVICYGPNEEVTTLPGLALDADPRFPFYNISQKIDEVEAGEGKRVDSYLQLKTVKSDRLKGKILIDSPGFDADSQRDAVLRITDHIIDMSDLVLIFFDARHPEPGAMRDTLEHLVGATIERNDANKFLYILNQIDTTAQEDNPEEVIGSWQRALSQKGLYGGNFYTIYNEDAAVPIEDPALAERFKRKKDEDLRRILERMEKVSNERAYRIVKMIEHAADEIEQDKLPKIREALAQWRKRVVWSWVGLGALLGALIVAGEIQFHFIVPALSYLAASPTLGIATAVVAFVAIVFIHFKLRGFWARRIADKWQKRDEMVARAVRHNNRWWQPLFSDNPRGWGRRTQKLLAQLRADSKRLIQQLNDQFAAPSGSQETITRPMAEITRSDNDSTLVAESGEQRNT
jgi:GTPase SAR1 family protein